MKKLSLHFVINNMHAPNGLITDVNNAINAGVHVIQYNDKKLRKREIVENAYILSALCKKNDVIFMMQDYPDIAGLVGADGVHLTQNDFSIEHVRRMLGDEKIIGVDVSSLRQAVEAEESGVDYLCINLAKENKFGATKALITKISKLKELVTLPIIVMGQLSPEVIQDFMQQEIDGVGMLAPTVKSFDMGNNIKEVLSLLHTQTQSL